MGQDVSPATNGSVWAYSLPIHVMVNPGFEASGRGVNSGMESRIRGQRHDLWRGTYCPTSDW